MMTNKLFNAYPDTFYNGKYLLDSDKAFNFCLGNRSSGKSVYWLMGLMLKALCDKELFVYLRRYKSDVETLGSALFNDARQVMQLYDPDVLFDVYNIQNRDISLWQKLCSDNIVIQLRDTQRLKQGIWLVPDDYMTVSKQEFSEYYIGTENLLGYAIGLSVIEKYKSMSGMFTHVTTIFMDEFLSETMDYLHMEDMSYEPTQCFNFYQTVSRGGGQAFREGVKFVFCANCVQLFNPYFMFLGLTKQIKNNTNKETGNCKLKTEGLALEIVNKPRLELTQSSFGKLIEGTSYNRQMQHNEWLLGIPQYFITDGLSFDKNSPLAVFDGIGVFGVVNNAQDKPFGRTSKFYFAKSKAKPESTPYDISMIQPYIKMAWSMYHIRFESIEIYNQVANKYKL